MREPRTYPTRRLWHYALALLLLIALTWLGFTVFGHPRDGAMQAPAVQDVPAAAAG